MQEMQDMGSIVGSGRPPVGGNDNPLQYSCLGNPMNRGYSPWGCKESGVTEHTHTRSINMGRTSVQGSMK